MQQGGGRSGATETQLIATDRYVLETGDIALEGAAAQLANDPKVIDTYLGLTKKAA